MTYEDVVAARARAVADAEANGECVQCLSQRDGCWQHPRDGRTVVWDYEEQSYIPLVCSGCGKPCADCTDGCPEALAA